MRKEAQRRGAGVKPSREAMHTLVQDIMTRDPLTIRGDYSVEQVTTMLLERGLSRVPVVDDTGRPIGILSKTDLVEESHARGDTQVDQRGADQEPGRHIHQVDALVRDVMTSAVAMVPPTASLAEAAHLMVMEGLHALPVVSGGEVIGVLSSSDLMAWVAGLRLPA